jgi:hypothetical protein
MIIHDATDTTVCQQRDVKIQQQAQAAARQLEIRNELSHVNSFDSSNGLDLDDDLIFDDDIQPIATFQSSPFVDQRQRYLASNREAPVLEFKCQTGLIG